MLVLVKTNLLDKHSFISFINVVGAKAIGTTELKAREDLRDSLQCLNFQWYLDYVYPDAPFPNQHKYLGPVR